MRTAAVQKALVWASVFSVVALVLLVLWGVGALRLGGGPVLLH